MTTTSSSSVDSLPCPPRYGTPRNLARPSLGGKVAEVMVALGRPPTPWQRHVLDVALELGLTKSQSARLVGATRDELLADGKVLAADLGITLPGDEKGGDNAGFDFSAPAPAGPPSRTGMPKGFAVETKSDPAKAASVLPPLNR